MNLSKMTKLELQAEAEKYGVDLPYWMSKPKMVKRLEVLLKKEKVKKKKPKVEKIEVIEEPIEEELPKSARVKLLEELNKGE